MKQTRIANEIERALRENRPVVALETTLISHGLPYPANIETALDCARAISEQGAAAATIGIVEGQPTIGLNRNELEAFATGKEILKVNRSNLAAAIVQGRWGATTVAATIHLASRAGIKVFSTGGIGGVHRGFSETLDISSDLTTLTETPIITVCAGAKAILDLAKTLEYLETVGVPVVGYNTTEFPAFYTRSSGLELETVVSSPDEIAQLAFEHWHLGNRSAVLVAVPIPEEAELAPAEIDRAIEIALEAAKQAKLAGKAVTPFLLSMVEKLTEGRSLQANRALILNNARVAAQIAVALTELEKALDPS